MSISNTSGGLQFTDLVGPGAGDLSESESPSHSRLQSLTLSPAAGVHPDRTVPDREAVLKTTQRDGSETRGRLRDRLTGLREDRPGGRGAAPGLGPESSESQLLLFSRRHCHVAVKEQRLTATGQIQQSDDHWR